VSVNTVPKRSYNTRIHTLMAHYMPSLEKDAARLFSLGNDKMLRALFADAGFSDITIATKMHRFAVPSFDDYFAHIERGWGSAGQVFVSLPEDIKRAVRDDARRDLGDNGGPIEIEVEFMFASGWKLGSGGK
jgi:hypothetical protein